MVRGFWLAGALGLVVLLSTVSQGAATTFHQEADTLTSADRARIESYGEAFVRGIGASPEAHARIVSEVFAEATVAQYGVARVSGLFDRLHADLGAVEFDNAELPNGGIADPATLAWLDRYVTKLATDEGLSGSLLVARGDTPIFERVFGSEDAEGARPVTARTQFNLGSGNKMFTALVVARLVEEGRLTFDAPLGRWFPDLLDAGTRERATVHHLLSHTSGIGDYWTPEYEAAWREIDDLEGMLPFVRAAGVDFEPGTRWAYSNSNFLLAGLIVERVTGEPYFDVVRRMIYEPLGMTRSGSFRDSGSESGRADPLSSSDSRWVRASLPLRGSSAGGGYSTTGDMLRFVRGLVDGRIVTPSTLQAMVRPHNRELAAATRYGYGFILSTEGGVPSFGHGGTANGINFELRYFPDEDLTLVLFSNQDNGAYDDLRRNTIRLVTGER